MSVSLSSRVAVLIVSFDAVDELGDCLAALLLAFSVIMFFSFPIQVA